MVSNSIHSTVLPQFQITLALSQTVWGSTGLGLNHQFTYYSPTWSLTLTLTLPCPWATV